MRLLLDTHAFLWWATDNPRLSKVARELIATGRNEVWISVASVWEIAIKARLGRLQVPPDFGRFLLDQIETNGFQVLPIQLAHALEVSRLEDHHRDPFDRVLVAQSRIERVPLISADIQLDAYGIERRW
ncbi:MAG: type II toxin-antitoxin system VapC family toxin [Rhodospirillales bacterium]|nr:type II toxin-antitoxin system VapC family toxin [Rhodospirillales bacterium]